MTATEIPIDGQTDDQTDDHTSDSDRIRQKLLAELAEAKGAFVVFVNDVDDEGISMGIATFVDDDMDPELRQHLFREMQLRAIVDSDVPAPVVHAAAELKAGDDPLAAVLANLKRGGGGGGSAEGHMFQ